MSEQQTERNKVLERIKKLLALSTSSNQAEAELAMQRAQELMSRHTVTESELDRGEIRLIEHLFKKRRVEKWANQLIYVLAQHNFCHVAIDKPALQFNTDYGKWMKTECKYDITGRATNIQVVQLMFDYLSSTAERLAEEFTGRCSRAERTIRRNSFLVGFVIAIHDKLKEQKKAWIDEDASFGTALIKVGREDESAIAKFFAEQKIKHTKAKSAYQSQTDAKAYKSGYQAGQETTLERQVAGQRKMLTGGAA